MTRRGFLAALAAVALGDRTMTEAAPAERDCLRRVQTPRKHPRLVLEASYRPGEFDSHAVDCPFVYRHAGRFWMTYIGFDGLGYRTGLASSDDLVAWRKEGLLLDRGPVGSVTEHNVALTWVLRDNDLFGSGEPRRVDGRYVGTYHAYPRPGYEVGPAVIGICTSPDLREWRLEPPCLRSADGSAWERGGLYKSCLVQHGRDYLMFYNAKTDGSPWREQTGYAVSRDLRTWRRADANPVVPVGPAGAWDDVFASDPCVLRVGDTWAMFYYGLSTDGRARDGVAFSRDLHTWTKAPAPLIDVGPEGSIDSRYAHKPSLFAWRGRVHHYYCAVAPAPGGRIGEIATGERRGIALAMS